MGNLPARGALMQTDEHPEWRQFLILAATRRADELNRLHDLPDTPVQTGNAAVEPKMAGLPTDRSEADPEDETGTITSQPGVTIPIEIGETSSTELPMTPADEKPPVIRAPERLKQPSESARKSVRHARRVKPPNKPVAVAQFNLFEAIFGAQNQQAAASQQAGLSTAGRPISKSATGRADQR
jgi:hypothetical protein